MFTLTERRMAAIHDILEKHLCVLGDTGATDCVTLEMSLRESMETGYREIKDIMRQLIKDEQYSDLAAYYMQHQNASGPVVEFKGDLATFYGVPHYDSEACKQARVKFWSGYSAGRGSSVGDDR